MSTTSVRYGQHPRRTAALVALVVVSLTATTTGTGLVMAGPASAQSPTPAAGREPEHHTSLVEHYGLSRHDGLSAAALDVRPTAGPGSDGALGTSAPDASSTGPGP